MKKQRPLMLYISQYGSHYHARNINELRAQIKNGRSRVSKMYVDGADGNTYHTVM